MDSARNMATDPVPGPDLGVMPDDTSAIQSEALSTKATYLTIPQEIRDAIYDDLETPELLNFILVNKVHRELIQPYLYSNATFKLNIGYPDRCSEGCSRIHDGHFVKGSNQSNTLGGWLFRGLLI